MKLNEYIGYDGMELSTLVNNKDVTPKELALLALEGFEKVNPKVNAVIEFYKERIQEADTLELEGKAFSGVPFLLKDLSASEAGRFQEMGSRLTKGFTAHEDSFLTTRFKEAGLVLLGRTATPELGLAATTESLKTGITRNPWNLELIAGGSSGGAAAAVAAGIVPMAHASDGGGSIRIPAACCGTVGLKPSRGRITSGPAVDETLFGLATNFIISRTVRDTAAMLDAVSLPAPGDPFVISRPHQSFLKEKDLPVGKLRIAYTGDSWTGAKSDPEIIKALESVAGLCEDMGHHVEENRPRFALEPYFMALGILWGTYLKFSCDNMAATMGREINESVIEPITLKIYNNAKKITATDVLRAKIDLNVVCRCVGQFFETYDVLLTPTISQFPAPIGTMDQSQKIDLDEWESRTGAFNAFTNLYNATGCPAISLPLCHSSGNLPIGIQFGAGFGREADLLRLAKRFEGALPWKDRLPPWHAGNV